jgi:hypothetical protein
MVPSSFTAATASDLIADINAANKAHGANTITLTAPTTSPYVLTAVDNTTDGPTGLPVIANNDNLTIRGNGDVIERSAGGGTPAFRLLDVAGRGSLTLENLTLQNGYTFGSGVSAEGGAILNKGAVALNDVTVQGNLAQGSGGVEKNNWSGTAGQDAAGGGIYSSGSLTLEGGTLIQNNQALGGWGSFASNKTAGAGGNAFGGGVCVAGGTASLTDVTLSSNTAAGGRGGDTPLYVTPGAGGSGLGGGLYVNSGEVTMTGATLSSNTAQGGRGGVSTDFNTSVLGPDGNGFGGGLYISAPATVSLDAFTLAHVINNTASASNNDIFGSYVLAP